MFFEVTCKEEAAMESTWKLYMEERLESQRHRDLVSVLLSAYTGISQVSDDGLGLTSAMWLPMPYSMDSASQYIHAPWKN